MEMQVAAMSNLLAACREKALSRTHTTRELSAGEKQAYQNCLQKFGDVPAIVM